MNQDANSPESEFTPVNSIVELATYFDSLSQPGTASLTLVGAGEKEHPLVVVEQQEENYLLFDLTAIRDVAPPLRRGRSFILSGFTPGGFVRSNPITIREFTSVEGRLLAYADWPTEILVKQRRASFRASLRIGMNVGVHVRKLDEESNEEFAIQGDLKDLSATGCLAEFFMQDGVSRVLPDIATEIELYFPNGSSFKVKAVVRHLKTDHDRQALAVGFEFVDTSQAQEREIWNYVREIEREASRSAGSGSTRSASELFEVHDENDARLSRRHGHQYPTPMARRLARIAGYLDSEMVMLKQDHGINSEQLSVHAERLLDMLIDHREETLFALVCLQRESRWIRHGLAVAVRLVDLLNHKQMPRSLLKGMAAAAMLHDLGKSVVATELWGATTLSADGYREMHEHVAVVLHKTKAVKWLPDSIVENIIAQINERLDGSGYPNGVFADQLGQLARAAAVVDVLDALQRPRADRNALTPVAALHLARQQNAQLDQQWVGKYQKHFGMLPIGTLLRFDSGAFAWVVGLDAHKKVCRVRVSPHGSLPDKDLGPPIEGSALAALGRIKEIVVPES